MLNKDLLLLLSKSSAILKCSLVDNRRTQRVFVGSKMRISRAKWPSVKLHLRGRGRSAETQEQRRLLRSLYQGRLQAEYSGMKVVFLDLCFKLKAMFTFPIFELYFFL